jgi:hypothetical protein
MGSCGSSLDARPVDVNVWFWRAPGEVYAPPEHLAAWKFPFDFDKVLLFSRGPIGTGEVIEIERTAGA